ncbi:MAG TPA: hypothetical protein VGW38_19820 [Chloroflexota bacterium]|nr:hypothetical protein [Chloroflexota bacterium]
MHRQVTVSPARWWHMPGLSRLIRQTRRMRSAPPEELGSAIVWVPGWSPSLALLQSVSASPVIGARSPQSIVAEYEGTPIGLAQLRPRREPNQWEVAYLAVEAAETKGASSAQNSSDGAPLRSSRTPGFSPDRTAARLLGALCDTAVSLHAERVFARVAEDNGRYELFRRLGFAPAVREYTYFLPSGFLKPGLEGITGDRDSGSLVEPIPGLRPQQRSDTFGLLQLYQQCTPKVIQMAEGKRTHLWETPTGNLGKHLTRRPRVQRWVVEVDARMVAWLQIEFQSRSPHRVQLLVDDRSRALVHPLLDFVTRLVGTRLQQGIIVFVREPQTHVISALELAGFELADSQLLMVKLLATPVLQPQFGRVMEKVVS